MKRHPERFPVDMPAKFRAADSEQAWQDGRLLNLSEGGVCLEAEAELLPGEMLELVVESKDKKGLSHRRLLRARVIWSKNGRIGLEFSKAKKAAARSPQKKVVKPKLVVARGKASNKG